MLTLLTRFQLRSELPQKNQLKCDECTASPGPPGLPGRHLEIFCPEKKSGNLGRHDPPLSKSTKKSTPTDIFAHLREPPQGTPPPKK